jgi:hypothetical protein
VPKKLACLDCHKPVTPRLAKAIKVDDSAVEIGPYGYSCARKITAAYQALGVPARVIWAYPRA